MTIHVYDDGNDVLRVEEEREVEIPVLDKDGAPTGKTKTESQVVRTGLGWVSAMTNHFDLDNDGEHVGAARPMTKVEREAYVRSLLPEPAPAAPSTPNPKPLMTI